MTPVQLVNNLLEDDPLPVPISDLFHVPRKGLVLKLEEGKYWSLYHDTYDIRFGEIYRTYEDDEWVGELYRIKGWISGDSNSFNTFNEVLDFLISNEELVRALEVLNSLNLPEWLKIIQYDTGSSYYLIFYIMFEDGTVLRDYSNVNSAKIIVESPKLREVYEVISAYLKNPDQSIKIKPVIADPEMLGVYPIRMSISVSKMGKSLYINTNIDDSSGWKVDNASDNCKIFDTFFEAFNYVLNAHVS